MLSTLCFLEKRDIFLIFSKYNYIDHNHYLFVVWTKIFKTGNSGFPPDVLEYGNSTTTGPLDWYQSLK